MHPLRQLRDAVDGAASRAQARMHAFDQCSAAGARVGGPVPVRTAATPMETLLDSTRRLCSRAKAQLQLHALQALSQAIAALPEQQNESATSAFARAKAAIESDAASATAERDRLRILQVQQVRAMTEAPLSADKHRALSALTATNRGIVAAATTLEQTRAAAVALVRMADAAFLGGDEAALAAFVAEAYAVDVARGVCTQLLSDVVATLRESFGAAAGLERVSAALEPQEEAAMEPAATAQHQGAATGAALPATQRAADAPRRRKTIQVCGRWGHALPCLGRLCTRGVCRHLRATRRAGATGSERCRAACAQRGRQTKCEAPARRQGNGCGAGWQHTTTCSGDTSRRACLRGRRCRGGARWPRGEPCDERSIH